MLKIILTLLAMLGSWWLSFALVPTPWGWLVMAAASLLIYKVCCNDSSGKNTPTPSPDTFIGNTDRSDASWGSPGGASSVSRTPNAESDERAEAPPLNDIDLGPLDTDFETGGDAGGDSGD